MEGKGKEEKKLTTLQDASSFPFYGKKNQQEVESQAKIHRQWKNQEYSPWKNLVQKWHKLLLVQTRIKFSMQ